MKRILVFIVAILFAGVSVFSGIVAFAGDSIMTQKCIEAVEGVECSFEHEHDEDCGYVEAHECEVEVEHEHDEDCGYVEEVEGQDCLLAHEHDEDCGYAEEVEGVEAVDCDFECDHSDCAYVEASDCEDCIPAVEAIECDHSGCAKADAIEAVAGVACDFDAVAYEADIASYFTFGTYGWVNARVDAFDADLNRLWFYLDFESGVAVEAITITLTDEAGNEVVAVAKYNALAAANAGYAEIVFRDKDGGVYPFAHNGYWDTILTELEEGVNEVASIKVELTTDDEVIVAVFGGDCALIIPACDHSDCAYVEEVVGVPAVPCDVEMPAVDFIPCGEDTCTYADGVDCDAVCDHSGCSYVEGVEAVEGVSCGFEHEHDEDCGYVAVVAGVDCTFEHEHDEDCGYIEGVLCGFEHDHSEVDEDGESVCGYVEEVEGQEGVSLLDVFSFKKDKTNVAKIIYGVISMLSAFVFGFMLARIIANRRRGARPPRAPKAPKSVNTFTKRDAGTRPSNRGPRIKF